MLSPDIKLQNLTCAYFDAVQELVLEPPGLSVASSLATVVARDAMFSSVSS